VTRFGEKVAAVYHRIISLNNNIVVNPEFRYKIQVA